MTDDYMQHVRFNPCDECVNEIFQSKVTLQITSDYIIS